MTEHSVLLRFSYFEHDWDEAIDGPEAAEAELLRRAAADWQQVEGEEAPDEFDTLEELAQRLEEC